MSPEVEKYYEEMHDMFQTPGWQHFCEDMKAALASVTDLNKMDSGDDLWFCKGQAQVLTGFLNLPVALRESHEMLSRESLEDFE